MGIRKIKERNYTRDVALPLDWIKSKGLDAGDKVELELTRAGNLLVKPLKRTQVEM